MNPYREYQCTACNTCKFFQNDGKMWYDHTCLAVENPPEFDYVNGMMKKPLPKRCRDVNRGSCKHYVKK